MSSVIMIIIEVFSIVSIQKKEKNKITIEANSSLSLKGVSTFKKAKKMGLFQEKHYNS